MKEKFPELTQQPIENIDGTPDKYYAIRILEAYRKNCNCRWSTSIDGECISPIFTLMNEHCEQRAKILDRAIAILQNNME